MAIMSAIGTGIGALGIGVGKMGFGLGRGIWNAGSGGKGFLIGAAAGGAYGAASAQPYESGLKRGLWGAGIGGFGGAIGGAAIGAGIRRAAPAAGKAAGAIKNAMAGTVTGPEVSAFEAKILGQGAAREAKAAARSNRIMAGARGRLQRYRGSAKAQMNRTGGREGFDPNRYWEGDRWSPVRLQRSPLTRMKGAIGSAVNRAKNYKFDWLAKHRNKSGAPAPIIRQTPMVRQTPIIGINPQYGPAAPKRVSMATPVGMGIESGRSPFLRTGQQIGAVPPADSTLSYVAAGEDAFAKQHRRIMDKIGGGTQRTNAMSDWSRSGGSQATEAEWNTAVAARQPTDRYGSWTGLLG